MSRNRLIHEAALYGGVLNARRRATSPRLRTCRARRPHPQDDVIRGNREAAGTGRAGHDCCS